MRKHAELSTAWDHIEPSLGRNVMWQQQSVIHSVQNTLRKMNVRWVVCISLLRGL